jgi:subtilisin-like proprotein convertase family protein
MVLASRPRRSIVSIAVLTLALAGLTVAASAPVSATVTSEFVSTTTTYLGDDLTTLGGGQSLLVPATGSAGPANPYPAQMGLGVPLLGPEIVDVDLTILNLTSTAPGDLNLLLVSPTGQQALVMSDIGAGNDVSNVTFTFSDEAVISLGDATIVNGAVYAPQNQGGDGEVFPAPAPALDGNSALSVFDGQPVGGYWQLYVVDDQTDDVHTIGGWSLKFVLATTPYPNTIEVSGLPAVSDVNVRLDGFDSDRPDDAHFLLVGPHGQQAYLMGDAGGSVEDTEVSLTFDDEAAGVLPDSTRISSGTYRPFLYGDPDFFPAPAPAVSGSTSLSVFDGIDPDGQWKLFGVDDQAGELVRLDGWALELSWEDTVSPTGTVVVNGDAARTRSRDVTVDLTGADPEGTGVASVRLSNDGVTFSPYQAFAGSLPWTLAAGDGSKRVYAQFKDAAGNESTLVIDSIVLDTTGPRAGKLSPGRSATGVAATVKVRIKATEALRQGSVSATTVFLKRKGATVKVPARVSYQAAERTILLVPRGPLRRHTTYVVTVRAVRDSVGNRWDEKPSRAGAQALTWSFTTG